MRIDIDALEPWDLTLVLGGKAMATQPPTWGDVVALDVLERSLKPANGGQQDPKLEGKLRVALGNFLQPDDRPVLDAVPYDRLLAAFAAASKYFGEWLKKKQAAAVAPFAPPPAPKLASQAGRPPTPGV